MPIVKQDHVTSGFGVVFGEWPQTGIEGAAKSIPHDDARIPFGTAEQISGRGQMTPPAYRPRAVEFNRPAWQCHAVTEVGLRVQLRVLIPEFPALLLHARLDDFLRTLV